MRKMLSVVKMPLDTSVREVTKEELATSRSSHGYDYSYTIEGYEDDDENWVPAETRYVSYEHVLEQFSKGSNWDCDLYKDTWLVDVDTMMPVMIRKYRFTVERINNDTAEI